MTAPAGSGVTNKGTTYADGSQVTSTNLNDIVDDAVFNTNAVDDTTIGLNSSTPKALFVKNQGIDTAQIADDAITFDKLSSAVLDAIYPIGSVYTNATDGSNPGDSDMLGFGTWVQFAAGRMMLGFGEGTDERGDTVNFSSVGDEAGEYQHVNTSAESGVPAHTHGGIIPSGGTGSVTEGFDVDNPTSAASRDFEKTTSANTATDATNAHNNMPPYIVVYMWRRTA